MLTRPWSLSARRGYRKIAEEMTTAQSMARVINHRLKYPGLSIDMDSTIGKGCSVVCVDGSSMSLAGAVLKDGAVVHADHGGHIEITDSFVGYRSVIVACLSVRIGAGCWIGEMVVIRDQDHVFGDGQALSSSGYTAERVEIGDNVWIGAKATILKGVQVGENSVIAASAVVNRDVRAGWLYAGVPARPVRALNAGR